MLGRADGVVSPFLADGYGRRIDRGAPLLRLERLSDHDDVAERERAHRTGRLDRPAVVQAVLHPPIIANFSGVLSGRGGRLAGRRPRGRVADLVAFDVYDEHPVRAAGLRRCAYGAPVEPGRRGAVLSRLAARRSDGSSTACSHDSGGVWS